MGALLSVCQPNHCKTLGLSDNPRCWSDKDKVRAARVMFDRYDADDSGTLDSNELTELFQECGTTLGDFGLPDAFDLEATVTEVYKRYRHWDRQPLDFELFLPIFRDMIATMAAEGYVNKQKLEGVQNLVTEACGEIHMLIVSLDYTYNPALQLTGVSDGRNMERLAKNAGVQDIVSMYDTEHLLGSSMFPHAGNVCREMQKMGKKCKKGDIFIFFYSGHGLNVPDLDGDESDGEDEAFACPDADGDLTADDVLVDDDFARYLDKHIPKQTRILVITDCCHSGTICDVNSFHFEHKIIAIASSQDNQTSLDMSSFGREGGILTTAIGASLKEFETERRKEYSVHEMYNACVAKTCAIAIEAKHEQAMNIQHANITPAEFPWPLKAGWW